MTEVNEVTIESIGVDPGGYQYVVILKDETTERYLPIWIASAEANAIAVKLQGLPASRPSTHDLLCSTINILGATVESIVVTELKDGIFYARITLRVNSQRLELDSRPSDALALAVRVQAPIFAEESVLNKAGLWLDKETGKLIVPEEGGENRNKKKGVSQEELRKMSAFTDFINTLNLDDIANDET